VPSNFHDGSAIHGQLYAAPWEVDGDRTLVTHGGGGGWPWEYDAMLQIEVGDSSIRLQLSVTNTSDGPMPVGVGIHPWFRRPVRVSIPARAVFPLNAATDPDPVPVRQPFDLRTLADMPDDLDATWTDLDRARVDLQWPDSGLRAVMSFASTQVCVVAASPSGLDAIAVEPQTHAPQGLRRLLQGEPSAMQLLSPGATHRLKVGLQFTRDA
jgi:aldose 1-epimerase